MLGFGPALTLSVLASSAPSQHGPRSPLVQKDLWPCSTEEGGGKEDRETEVEVGNGDEVTDRDEDGVGDGKKMEMEVGLETEMKLEME